MADENKDQRIVVLMTPSESAAIDEWSFANRIRSKGEAIRRLCQMALTYDEEAEGVARGAERLLEKAIRDDHVEAVEAGEITIDKWLLDHFASEGEIVDAIIELTSHIRSMEVVRKFYGDGEKNPSLHRAEEMRVKLREMRDRRQKAFAEKRGE